MAFTQAQLDALDEAIAAGVLTVSDGKQSVTYASLDDLLKRRSFIAGQLGASSQPPRVSYVRPVIARPRAGG